MRLAKEQLDVGFMVGDWPAAERFWTKRVGLRYDRFEKIGGGVRQHRFDAHGSVVKVNHARQALAQDPTIHRRVRIAHAGTDEPTLLHDPEGVEVELVPPGHDGVVGIEITNATADLTEAARFWQQGLGAIPEGTDRFRLGTTLVQLVAETDLVRPSTRHAAGLRYLTVQVFDVDAQYERLQGLGFTGEIAPISLGSTARIAFVRDPDGGYLEISQRAEVTGAPIPPGAPGTVVP